jgi:hypothetical protein
MTRRQQKYETTRLRWLRETGCSQVSTKRGRSEGNTNEGGGSSPAFNFQISLSHCKAMPILFRDYETRSTCDLKASGAFKYSTHPGTDVWCCSYCVDDDPIELWTPGDPVPEAFIEAARNPDWLVAAFNDGFERLIEQHIRRRVMAGRSFRLSAIAACKPPPWRMRFPPRLIKSPQH